MSTTIVVTKTPEGKLEGVGEKCRRALFKFHRWIDRLEPGECFTLNVYLPRNPKLLGLHFVMLTKVHDAQEQFVDPEKLRMWLQVGAGYVDQFPGPNGTVVSIPQSIAYDKMDDIRFGQHHEDIKAFLRSEYAQAFLWPHLSPFDRGEMVERILLEVESGR